MSSTKRREGASNSHILTVVEKLLIIHSINGNAAKCLRFYGPLPVWCALNRNRRTEMAKRAFEDSEVPAKRKQWMALSHWEPTT